MERRSSQHVQRKITPPEPAGDEHKSEEHGAGSVRVVAVGAAAGGAEALAAIFSGLPSPTGMAFVIVQHVEPADYSALVAALQRSTKLPVEEIQNGTVIHPDRVYVSPPDRDLTVSGGVLHLKARSAKGTNRTIDRFFASLAAEQSSRAIGVVLSGSEDDGSVGLQAIHDGGGITFVQDSSAQYGLMPAAASAAADFVLAPAAIAEQLVRVARGASDAEDDDGGHRFDGVLRLLHARFGVDFSPYKRASIHRRILRRVLLDGYSGVDDYLKDLPNSEALLETLHQDLLIGVTSFFREPEQHDILRNTIFPQLLGTSRSDPLRIWVAGCSTGEEVYSITIAVLEYLGERRLPVTVFGTDINAKAIDVARAGFYTDRALANVSAARRARFFTPAPGGYRVSKQLRELCVFAKHDLTSDPPYVSIDLLTCCNVLIYFGKELQQHALAAMHYALAPAGVLMLGSAETLRRSTLFAPVRPKAPFYRKIAETEAPLHAAARRIGPRRASATDSITTDTASARKLAEVFPIDREAPCGVLVNESSDILQLRGNVDPYVRLNPGRANLTLFHLLRHPEVLAELRPGLRRAVVEGTRVRLNDVATGSNGDHRTVSIEIVPVHGNSSEALYWVLFRSGRTEPSLSAEAGADEADASASLRHALNAAVEERERLASEAVAASEEAQSSDEELRSVNEELETAKEELQSANEELMTLNSELLSRNTSLLNMNDDLQNVLSAIEVPMVLVGIDGNIRRFNSPAAVLFHLDADSQGMPLSRVEPINEHGPDISRLVAKATAAHAATDHEICDRNDRWRLLRIRPYRTSEGTVDGAILAVFDIDKFKTNVLAAEKSARLSNLLARGGAILASSLDYETTLESLTKLAVPDFADWCSIDLLAEDGSIRHLAVSQAAPFQRDPASDDRELNWSGDPEAVKRRHPTFREAFLISEVSPSELSGQGGEARHAQLIGALGLKSTIRAQLRARDRTFGTITFSISDRTYCEEDLRFANELARQAAMAIDSALLYREAEEANCYLHSLLATVAHEIRTPLTSILGWTQLAVESAPGEDTDAQIIAQIDQSAKLLKVFVDDLLDTERIKLQKLRIEKEEVDFKTIAETATEMMRKTAEAKGIALLVNTGDQPAPCIGDHGRLLQVVWNLVSNAIKFTPEGGEVRVSLTLVGPYAQLSVADTGSGISPAAIGHVFDLFHQNSESGERSAGLGLGLAIVREVVRLHFGSVEAKSDGEGKGTTFTVLLPLKSRRQGRRRSNRRKAATRV